MTPERELQDVATLVMGTSPRGDTYNNDGIGVPLLNGPTEFGQVHPDCSLFTTAPVRVSERGDLLFCVRASTGRMNWADRAYAIGRGVAAIRSDSALETRFLRYSLEARLPALLKRAGGGTFSNLRQGDIATFPIPWPEARDKIAAILVAYDELIENNLRRIEVMEEMAQSIYREWFVNFRYPGHEFDGLIDSPLGPIPEGWAASTLDDQADVVMGQSPKSKFYNEDGTGLPFHQGVSYFGNHFPSHVKYCTVTNRVARVGDILVSVRAPVGRINVADTDLVVGRGLAAVASSTGHQGFLYRQLREHFREEDNMGGGTIFKAITKGDLLEVPIVFSGTELVDAFERIERPMFELIWNLTRQNSNLRVTRDMLLPKLISGEIDVSDLEIDMSWLAA